MNGWTPERRARQAASHSPVATVGTLNGTANGCGQGALGTKRVHRQSLAS